MKFWSYWWNGSINVQPSVAHWRVVTWGKDLSSHFVVFPYATVWFHRLYNYIRRQQWDLCSSSAAFPFIAFKVVFYFVSFSKLAIVLWFRTWINASAVFVFKWWCFFLGVTQRWLFWGELPGIIASENMRGDLPNFRWALRLCILLPWLVHDWNEEKSICYLTSPCTQLCSFKYSKSDGGQHLRCHFLPTAFRAVYCRDAKVGMKCSRWEKKKAF